MKREMKRQMKLPVKQQVILALDTPSAREAFRLLDSLDELVEKVKVGPALFLQEGPPLIEALQEKGYKIFLDLKLHDIPNTVALGVRSAKNMGVWMFSVHLAGGKRMLEEAVAAADAFPLLVGITVLTSLNEFDLKQIGIRRSPLEQVRLLGILARETGLKAVVASPQETSMLRSLLGPDMLIVTPGIRFSSPGGSAGTQSAAQKPQYDDQARAMSPREAVESGADYLVIGRPIVQAKDPAQMLKAIHAEMEKG